MPQTEQLLGPTGPSPRFATAFRGYDREQVDSWLAEHERRREEAASLAEAAEQERALESRLSELEVDSPHGSLPEPLAAYVLDRARDVARQLPERVVHEAQAERTALQQAASEEIETARARSAQIVGAARRDQDEVAAAVDQARSQIDLLRRQASDGAKERVQHTWRNTTSALTEVELELAGLRARRQIIAAELEELEESVHDSRAQLHQDGTAHGDVGRGPAREEAATPSNNHNTDDDTNEIEIAALNDRSRPASPPKSAPEVGRWALMPIEW